MAGIVKGHLDAGTMKFKADVDGFDAMIDYPMEDSDYTQEAPVPGGYLSFALAGCKALVIGQYFQGRGKEVEVDVEINPNFDPDADGRVRVDFQVDITLSGDVDEDELAKVEKIVDDACAIEHIILRNDNTVQTNYSVK